MSKSLRGKKKSIYTSVYHDMVVEALNKMNLSYEEFIIRKEEEFIKDILKGSTELKIAFRKKEEE